MESTIQIGTYKSVCLACGQFADFHDVAHATIPGNSEVVGCGVVWTTFKTFYDGSSFINIVKSLRPDLTFSGENTV
jgi:hypothetical protein